MCAGFLCVTSVDSTKERGDEVTRVLMDIMKEDLGKRMGTLYVTGPLDAKRKETCHFRAGQDWGLRQLMNQVCRH